MRADILDSLAAVERLVPEWDALWRRTDRTTPFQSPHWLMPWWRAFGTAQPRVVAVRRGGALAGVLPAYVLDEPQGRKLLPIGAGTTDYLDLLGEGADEAVDALLRRAAAEGVGACDFIDVPPGSPLRSARPPPPWSAAWSEGSVCPVLRLDSMPSTIRRKLRMNRNRAERAGGWVVESATAETAGTALDALVTLHQGRWTGANQPGALSDPAVLAFQRLAVPRLQAAGLLRLCVLRIGGMVAAANLALLGTGRIYFYLSGFDRSQQFVSPGSLLLGAMLDEARAEGRAEAHFLRGGEAYKYAWGAIGQLNATGCFRVERPDR